MDFHLQNYNFMVGILVERELEHILRLIVCPRKQKFLTDKMNLIDLLAVLPFFLSVALVGLEDLQVIGKAGKIIRLLRIMRIMRIFKMVRHFAGLQSLVYTLQQAYKELGMLLKDNHKA